MTGNARTEIDRAARAAIARAATLRKLGEAPIDVRIVNLSETGCLLATDILLSSGTPVTLGVSGSGARVAKVTRADEHGLACAFLIPMTPDEVAAARTRDTVVIGAFPSMMRDPQTAPASPEGTKAQGTSLARRIRAVLAHWEALIR